MPRPRLARPALTLSQIRTARPGPRDAFLWDGLDHGLGVKITPTGSKIFIFQKSVNRRLKRYTLGPIHDLTLEEARHQARRIAALASSGRESASDVRLRQPSSRTVEDLWTRYFAEVVSVTNKPRTAAEKKRMWERQIRPVIGHLPVADVTDEDISAIIRSPMRFDEQGRLLGGKGAAGNLYRLLKHLFSRARAWGVRPREMASPLEGIAQPKLPRRERLLSSEEIGKILNAIDAMRAEGERGEIMGVIKAAVLTGARISELLNLEWEHVRRSEMELHLPDTKVGFSRRPLSRDTLALFEQMERERPGRFVFRSADQDAPLPYWTVRHAFRRVTKRAGVEKCSLHTLRHWFATTTANTVSNPRLGMALTGHKSHAAYLNYVHAEKAEALALADVIAGKALSLGRAQLLEH